MGRDEVWASIVKPRWEAVPCDPEEPLLFPIFQPVETFLCFACIERRLGRQLTQEDLNRSVWNAGWSDPQQITPFLLIASTQLKQRGHGGRMAGACCQPLVYGRPNASCSSALADCAYK
jgi:hypothetical protein